MIKAGYPRPFAGGGEAAASTGGQITPPDHGRRRLPDDRVPGAAYSTIVIAAIAPAFMHFFGVFWQVHFEAKRTGLRGLSAEDCYPAQRQLPASAGQP